MVDTVSPKKRSETMRAVKGGDTVPEMYVRRLVYSRGYRYRLHVRGLPGCPDLVFSSRRKVIFVHGCFWHQHRCKRGSRIPGANREYWVAKLGRNVERDRATKRKLKRMGWSVMVIWECETKPARLEELERRIVEFLEGE